MSLIIENNNRIEQHNGNGMLIDQAVSSYQEVAIIEKLKSTSRFFVGVFIHEWKFN
jgi:hypothetical protein